MTKAQSGIGRDITSQKLNIVTAMFATTMPKFLGRLAFAD
jgi:hypothetical protein